MTGATICSGIGAAELSAPWIAWQWCAEIEPFPSALLAQRFEHTNLGDITAPDFIARAKAFGPLDVLAAGTPCQAFSVAGARESLDDARGNLTLRFVEIVDAIDPRVVLWENVPGVLGTHDNAFGCFLGALVGHPAAIVPPADHKRWREGKDGRYFAWPDAGLVAGPRRTAAWILKDAQFFGVAQRRERVWLVASPQTSRIDPRKVLFEPAGVRRYSAAGREARETVAGTIGNRAKGGGGLGTDFDLAGGLQAVASQGQAIRSHQSAAPPSGSASAVSSLADAGAASPSVVAFTCKDYGADAGDVSPTLRSMGHNTSHANAGGQVAIAFNWQAGGTQGSLDASSDRTGALQTNQTPAICFNLRGRDDGAQVETAEVASVRAAAGGSSRSYVAQIAAPLTRNPFADNASQETKLVAHALRGDGFDASEDGTGRGTPLVSMCLNGKAGKRFDGESETFIASGWRVRRLTPTECERLQGMPDGWTAIPFRGKPAADGPRYKAIGNSWAVPNAKWVMDRIKAELEATR